MIKIDYKNSTCEEYYDSFSNEYLGTEKLCEYTYEGYSFNDLLCGSLEELDKIKDKIGEKKGGKKGDQIETGIKIGSVFNYGSRKPIISSFFNKRIKLGTCYYCNINFINNFLDDDGESKGYTFDHFFPKAKYPYLALSLHNFIPSCNICNNTLKKDRVIEKISPTSSQFNFDEKVKFKTFISKENKSFQIKKEDDFDLHLKEDFSNEYEMYMGVFKLNKRYQYHKDKVLEMIEKRKIYPDSRIKELAKITQRTEQKVKRDLFGDYLFEDGLHKRPLSKLIRDIADELGLVSDLEHLKILNQE